MEKDARGGQNQQSGVVTAFKYLYFEIAIFEWNALNTHKSRLLKWTKYNIANVNNYG